MDQGVHKRFDPDHFGIDVNVPAGTGTGDTVNRRFSPEDIDEAFKILQERGKPSVDLPSTGATKLHVTPGMKDQHPDGQGESHFTWQNYKNIPQDVGDIFKEGVKSVPEGASNLWEAASPSISRAVRSFIPGSEPAPEEEKGDPEHIKGINDLYSKAKTWDDYKKIHELSMQYDPQYKKIVKGVGGALQLVGGPIEAITSPFTGVVRSMLSRPLEQDTGIPKEITEMAVPLAIAKTGAAGKAATAVDKIRGVETTADKVGLVERAGNLGVDVPKVAMSEGIVPQTASAASNLPGANSPYVNTSNKMAAQMGGASERVAEHLGGGAKSTPLNTGSGVREGITDYAGRGGVLSNRISQLENEVYTMIPAQAKAPVSNTYNQAVKLQQEFEGAHPGTKDLNPTIQKVLDGVTNPGGMSFEGLRSLRTEVGETLKRGVMPDGVSDGQLRSLYKSLSDDIRDAAKMHAGPRGEQMWERVNAFERAADKRRGTLEKIIGTPNAARSDERIAESLLDMARSGKSADSQKLGMVKRVIPAEDWGRVQSMAVQRLGWIGEGDARMFDPAKFYRDYSRMPEEAKGVLFPRPIRNALDTIGDLSKRHNKLGEIIHSHPEAQSLIQMGAAVHMGNNPERIPQALGYMLMSKIPGWVMTRPASQKSIENWAARWREVTQRPSKASWAALAAANKTMTQALREDIPEDKQVELEKALGDVMRMRSLNKGW